VQTEAERRERKRLRNVAYYAAHREESLAASARWRAAHPDYTRAHNAAYKATHLQEIRSQRASPAARAADAALHAKHRAAHLAEMRAYERRQYAEHREHHIALVHAYRATHREEIRERARLKYAANRRAVLAARAAYYLAHREERRAAGKVWHAAHPENHAHSSARRRARKVGNGGTHTLKQWQDKCAMLANVCIYCGEAKPLTRDHNIPLTRGGTHDISNVLPACLSCNLAKHAMTAREYLDRKGVTLAAAACEQRMAERVTVRVPGGDLFVRAGPSTFELAGSAEYVFEGAT
jgi:hypothetical protein